jgi:hypothetical protein
MDWGSHMTEYIHRVHLTAGGSGHQQIEEVEWRRDGSPDGTRMSTAVLILLIERHGWQAAVKHAGDDMEDLRPVHPPRGVAYLQTYRQDRPTDSLLHLPRY